MAAQAALHHVEMEEGFFQPVQFIHGGHFIQRLDTVGGAAPTGSCRVAGRRLSVPYAATYVFYVPSLPRPSPATWSTR